MTLHNITFQGKATYMSFKQAYRSKRIPTRVWP